MRVCFCNRIRRAAGAAGTALARLLAPMLVSLLPALSVAQTPAASEVRPPPLMAPEPAPDAQAAPRPASPPGVDADVPPAPVPVSLALVLPLDSVTYGRAAEAVKAGFAAVADAAGAKYAVFAHGDSDVRAAFDRAREAGARVIVGPLLRDDVKAIAAAGGDLPWTIALNQIDEGSTLPPNVYTLTLGIESEAVQVARRARDDGAQTVAIIGSEAPLQKRFASAFVGAWVLQGGAAPLTFRFDRAPEMLAVLKREFARAKPDAVVLALDAPDALLVKPYLGQVVAYASSQVNERRSRDALRDLDGVRFVEIPWLADPSAAAFSSIARRDYPSPALDRLYALGIDAFRVALAFADAAPASLDIDGATGRLSLGASRQFVRTAVVLQFQGGEIVPAGGR